jgi:hypothetical protein
MRSGFVWTRLVNEPEGPGRPKMFWVFVAPHTNVKELTPESFHLSRPHVWYVTETRDEGGVGKGGLECVRLGLCEVLDVILTIESRKRKFHSRRVIRHQDQGRC